MGSDRSVVGTLWSIVATVRSGRRTLRPASLQALKSLGRRHLVDQVQVDVKKGGTPRLFDDDVALPDLFKHGFGCMRVTSDGLTKLLP